MIRVFFYDVGYGKTRKSRRTASTDGGSLLGKTGLALQRGAIFEDQNIFQMYDTRARALTRKNICQMYDMWAHLHKNIFQMYDTRARAHNHQNICPLPARIFVKCVTRGRAHLHTNIFQMYDTRARAHNHSCYGL